MVHRLAALALLTAPLVTFGGGAALAAPSAQLEVRGSDVVARVHGMGPPFRHAALHDDRGKQVAATAQEATVEPIAIVFVIQGFEIWMGNDDTVAEDDPSRYPGAFHGLQHMFDDLDLAHALPPGSEVGLMTYTDRLSKGAELRPAREMSSARLGTQHDYYGLMGTSLVPGIELAIDQLERSHAAHKLVIVIGDGNDTNNEAARSSLAALKLRAAAGHIGVHAIIYKGPLSDPGNVISRIDDLAQTVNAVDSFAPAVTAQIGGWLQNGTLTFPTAGLTSDGRPHALTLELDDHAMTVQDVVLPATPEDGFWSRSLGRTWFQLALGSLVLGLLALVARWRASRPD